MSSHDLSLSELLDRNRDTLVILMTLSDEDFYYLVRINRISNTLDKIGHLLILNTDQLDYDMKDKVRKRRDYIIRQCNI